MKVETNKSSSRSKLANKKSSSSNIKQSSGTKLSQRKSINKSIDVNFDQQRQMVRESYLKNMIPPDRGMGGNSALGSYNYTQDL